MVADVTRDGKYVTPKIDFLTQEGAKKSRPMPKGTLTIVCSGLVGIPSILNVDSCIHDGFLALRDISDDCELEYLYYVFWLLRNKLEVSATHGGVFTNLTTEILRELEIKLPPLSEQRSIAKILGTWDQTTELTQQLLHRKQELKKGIKQQLLTGNKRFPEFQQNHWRELKLSDFLELKLRKVLKPEQSYKALSIRSHGKGTFSRVVADPKKVAMTHLYEVEKDDLIVNITFAWEGAIATVKDEDIGCLVSHRFPTYVFNRTKVLPEYFRHVMTTKRFFHELGLISPGGAGRNRVLDKNDFLKIKVLMPDIVEQKRIVDILQTCDSETDLLFRKLSMLKQQQKGLLRKLLTGEIRVKV